MRRPAPGACRLALLLFASGCATSPDGAGHPFSGTAGPVEWEVTDVGRIERADGRRMRWSFTIVLRERAGTAIQFERIERGALGPYVETGGISRVAFARRLEARSELRLGAVENWGWRAPGCGASAANDLRRGVVLIIASRKSWRYDRSTPWRRVMGWTTASSIFFGVLLGSHASQAATRARWGVLKRGVR